LQHSKALQSFRYNSEKGMAIIRSLPEHNHKGNEEKAEEKQLRVRVRKRSEDVTSCPSDLQVHSELTLQPKDLKNLAPSLYRECHKDQPNWLTEETPCNNILM
jgi:hypothetical protein